MHNTGGSSLRAFTKLRHCFISHPPTSARVKLNNVYRYTSLLARFKAPHSEVEGVYSEKERVENDPARGW